MSAPGYINYLGVFNRKEVKMWNKLINLEEIKYNVNTFERAPWVEYMVINPHMLTEPANEFLYHYRRWGGISLDHTKMIDGTMLYFYKKKGSKV